MIKLEVIGGQGPNINPNPEARAKSPPGRQGLLQAVYVTPAYPIFLCGTM